MKENTHLKASLTSHRTSLLTKGSILAWIIFAVSILYYCYAYMLRVFPSIMTHDLLAHFKITAASFGTITAFYYFAYDPMQLPVGVALDKFGARKSLLVACLIALIGVFIFSKAQVLGVAEIGRFLMGFGAAFAYVTALKLATVWLPRRFFTTAAGFLTGTGMLVAGLTDLFLTNIVVTSGYRNALYWVFGIGIVVLILIFLIIRDKPKDTNGEQGQTEKTKKHTYTFKQLGQYLWSMARNPQMWLIGAIGAFMYLPASVFVDAWGPVYLRSVYHLTPKQAAVGVNMLLIGWALASPVVGALSEILHTRKYPLLISAFCAAFVATIIFYVPGLSKSTVYILLLLLGILCAAHPLCFTLSIENNPRKISGTSVAFANFLIMLGGVVFQPLVGDVLDWRWTGTMLQGARSYSSGDYTFALSILPIGLIIAGLLSTRLKDTYTRSKTAQHLSA